MAETMYSTRARFEAGQDVMQVCQETGMSLADAQWRYDVWLKEGLRKKIDKQAAEIERLREQVRVLREAVEAIIARVALVSPYYEQARAALDQTEPRP